MEIVTIQWRYCQVIQRIYISVPVFTISLGLVYNSTMTQHSESEMPIRIHTDGGCHGNPGPGGWAYILETGQEKIEGYGFAADTTNNRMELTAVIEALRYVVAENLAATSRAVEQRIEVHTDSRYVQQGITSWIESWERNGWRTSAKKPVKNQELWQSLRELQLRLRPIWCWVKGHSGNPLNERCDALVQEAIAQGETSQKFSR